MARKRKETKLLTGLAMATAALVSSPINADAQATSVPARRERPIPPGLRALPPGLRHRTLPPGLRARDTLPLGLQPRVLPPGIRPGAQPPGKRTGGDPFFDVELDAPN